jgi:succinate dehydrogenase/fumarate reductase flavoprotein subunit
MNYLTQTILYFTLPFIWVLLIGPSFIKAFRKYELGQKVRKEGPSAHYKKEGIPTMGGLLIDTKCRVRDENYDVIEGLYAAGEIIGGIHGNNRLGGNALTDNSVFGKLAGESVVKDSLALID